MVQTNFKFGPRTNGGYDGEMDVLAAKLKERELVHVETSSDADSWEERVKRIKRKFDTASPHYGAAFGVEFTTLTRLAVVGARAAKKPASVTGVEVISIDELMTRVKTYVRALDPMRKAVPEGLG